MRQLLNTLFVTSEDIYLSLDGENVVANRGAGRPLPGIRCTRCKASSPFLMRERHPP